MSTPKKAAAPAATTAKKEPSVSTDDLLREAKDSQTAAAKTPVIKSDLDNSADNINKAAEEQKNQLINDPRAAAAHPELKDINQPAGQSPVGAEGIAGVPFYPAGGYTGGSRQDNATPKLSFEIDDNAISQLRDVLYSSTPAERKKLRDLLNEFDEEPKIANIQSAANVAEVKPELTPEEIKDNLHTARLSKYGQGYVVASKPGAHETVFSAQTWNMLSSDKEGYKRVVSVPQEVAGLNK